MRKEKGEKEIFLNPSPGSRKQVMIHSVYSKGEMSYVDA